MHMESICTRTFLQSHHSILNRIHFICMIWIYIAENGITYSCIPLFAMHPSLVHHHLYIDSLCPIFGTQIDSISLNPFGYRNSILLMYYYVMSRPMSLESSRVALADGVKSSSDCWWCWHTNVKIAELCLWRKHSFWYYITKQCLQYDIELSSLYVVKAYFLYHSLHHYIAWREKESSAHCPTCQIRH